MHVPRKRKLVEGATKVAFPTAHVSVHDADVALDWREMAVVQLQAVSKNYTSL